ncbi:hypothetical protein J2T24_001209 [Pseudarthrobacter niigatensis]|nr:hypothetical protein [Pseudarthrobacter niigatensis]
MATQRKPGDQTANMALAGVQGLVKDLGSNAVAALLRISGDKLPRWLTGQETPNAEHLTKLSDLHSSIGPLHAAFTRPGCALAGRT